ncbi:MAG: RNA polymerase sigma factor RpoD/SigA [Patescibacteria group bacterium]
MAIPKETLDSVGFYFQAIEDIPVLSSGQEHALFLMIQAGDEEARNTLVKHNLRFVISVAKQYSGHGLPLADLISAGNLGLITAAERFDGNRGFKFISYAVWWIRQTILQALALENRGIRLPINRIDILTRISRSSAKLGQELGRMPTEDDVLDSENLKGKERQTMVDVLVAARPVLPLDAPLDPRDKDSNTVINCIRLEEDESQFIDPLDREVVMDFIEKVLEPREYRVLVLYFGLDDRKPLTLEKIGGLSEFGLTRERIRQIRDIALDKLRFEFSSKLLKKNTPWLNR